jgi:hypothetical protein
MKVIQQKLHFIQNGLRFSKARASAHFLVVDVEPWPSHIQAISKEDKEWSRKTIWKYPQTA